MLKHDIIKLGYKSVVKPILFCVDAEKVHNRHTGFGEFLGSRKWGKGFTRGLFAYDNDKLCQTVLGVEFSNPIGLAAGFDYDGHLAGVMNSVGFGFNTVGTVTAKPYEGNNFPRLARLPKSKSLLVNKGFKSEGADKVLERLDAKDLEDSTVGISVGSSNLPEVDSISKAVDDYLYTFEKFKSRGYVKYFELNVSCPNMNVKENFTDIESFDTLVKEVTRLNIKQPIFVKMPNEISEENTAKLLDISIGQNIVSFIFSNLAKDRSNKKFVPSEIKRFKDKKGNFSGKPTEVNVDKLIAFVRNKYGKNINIVGCGGVFDAVGAYRKIKLGANLVQLITGMVFEGPQLAGDINYRLVKLLKNDGFENISEAVGSELG